jgi:ATP-dependent Lhr-like helicase
MVAAPSFEAPETTLAELLAGWLAGFGPVDPDWIAAALDLEPEPVAVALDELAELQAVLLDQISEGAATIEVCDRENLERLLRMARHAARPSFRTHPPELLPLWLAHHQGLARRDATIDDLKAALGRLIAFPLPVELIETEILPARIEPYHPAWLDALLAETELEWFCCGERRIAFGLAGDRDLALDDPLADGAISDGGPGPADPLPPGEIGRYSFTDLLRRTGADSGQLLEALWAATWRGEVAADSFAPVRQGVASGFTANAIELDPPASRRRPSFDRWRSRLPVAGNWFRLPRPAPAADALDREEDDRNRARLLLERHGLLFRELVERELPAMRWGAIFRSLRMLELAGEVIAGRFFDGVPGLQFMSRAAFQVLEEGLPEDLVWWLNAADPASPCGLPEVDLGLQLPRRIPSNHLVFHGRRMVMVSERRGARLTISVGPDHPRLTDYLGVLKAQLGRSVQPRSAITVDEINGQPAGASPYRSALQELFQVSRSPSALKLARRY